MPFRLKRNSSLRTAIQLPASKSISNRALIINALSGAGVTPQNISDCDDTFVMVRALQTHPSSTTSSPKEERVSHIDIMAAGTAMRFLTAYLSVKEGECIITGTERMRHRPISILVDALQRLGADIAYEEQEGFPPLRIKGKRLEGGHISLPGNVSSQYISAMLMIGPTLTKGLTLTLTEGIASRPYIDMTISIMREFGAKAEWTAENVITVEPHPYAAIPYLIENDWSAASYWFELVALTPDSEVRLPGLFAKSLQGDQVVKDIFEKLGVDVIPMSADSSDCEGLVLRHTDKRVARLELDMLSCPDLAQTVVVTCCMLGVPFHITGLQSLKIKETDRITALQTELHKLGFVIADSQDSILTWEGERCEQRMGAAIDTYEDHRMAMAFAPCCQVLGEITINNPEVVSKSYPHFWDNLQQAGLEITTE